jgi:hypothetical protein
MKELARSQISRCIDSSVEEETFFLKWNEYTGLTRKRKNGTVKEVTHPYVTREVWLHDKTKMNVALIKSYESRDRQRMCVTSIELGILRGVQSASFRT